MAHDGRVGTGAVLPSPLTQTVLWCLAAAVTVGVLIADATPLRAPAIGWWSFAALTVLALAAARQDVWARVRTPDRDVHEMVDLDEVALVLLLFLLEPLWVVAVAIPTYGAALVVEHRPVIKTVFNLASRTATVGLAAWLVSPFTTPPVDELTISGATFVVGAILLHIALNFLSVKIVVTADTGSTLRRTIRTTADLNVVMWVGNATLGLAAAALWLQHPVLVLAAAGLATIVRRAYHTVVVVNELADELGIERDRLRQLVDGARDGILQLDTRGAVTVWNPALEQLTGVPAAVALGQPVDELFGAQLVIEEGADTVAAPVLGLASPDDQHLTVTSNGEERSLIARHSLQHDRDGDLVADIVQLHDRTASERAARLEHDFLARVTHELLTPLTVIRGVTQTVVRHGEELGPEIQRDLLQRLGRNAAQMEGLVHDLLAVNAGRNAASRPLPEVLDLWQVVRTAVLSETANCEDRAVELDGDEVVAPIRRAALTTVVRHLVRNACTYSPGDTPIHVSMHVDEFGTTAVLRVRDHGRGIPASRLEEMFGPFTRIEDPLHMETRGLGLGLYLVRQLVDELGGTVSAQSTPGEGSTFEVRVPGVLAVRQHSDSR